MATRGSSSQTDGRHWNLIGPVMEVVITAEPTIVDVARVVAQRRGRRIVLFPCEWPDPLQFGMWVADPEQDYIFFERRTARVHQEHIIAHELGHMLLGHTTLRVHHLSTQPEPGALMRAAGRLHETPEEHEAEAVAQELQTALIRRAGLERMTKRPGTAPLWEKLTLGMGV